MKTLYFDCFSGIAGDMAVGALLDLGAPRETVTAAVDSLQIEGLRVDAAPVLRGGLSGTAYQVELPHEHAHRTFADIRRMLEAARLTPDARALAVEIFRRIAVAEGALHREAPDEVTFHEVGAADSIADVVGFAAAFDALGIEAVRASSLPWSTGTVQAAHGELPVPAPATLALLKGFTLVETALAGELVTPTGAAILAATAPGTTGPGTLAVEGVGYGAGRRELPGRPNLLRAVLGEGLGEPEQAGADAPRILTEVLAVEATLDDLEGRLLGVLADRLRAAGARDVWTTPVQMKKGRPGTVVTALTRRAELDAVAEAFFRHSTTLGIRYRALERLELPRREATCPTRYGPVRFKVAGGRARPEMDDCLAIADREGLPVADVLRAAEADYPGGNGDEGP